ncbi:MAG TPA: tyrosine-type recombinase/integrase [Pyrinomonadaceae bacterium]|nr:tyrosine-type recombinase/integrase [Pyrinomonadaceae bacterium]
MHDLNWIKYPAIAAHEHAKAWLLIQANLGLARNTVDAYARALEDYLRFSTSHGVSIETATRQHLAAYVHDLANRPHPRGSKILCLDSGMGLANATLQQKLTALRLYYDYLIEEGLHDINPVGRGRYTPHNCFGGRRERRLIPRYRKLPWIPSDEVWQQILQVVITEPLRNRLMLTLAYDAALRREELCSLEIGDIDPAHRLLRIRAETTKNRQERVVPYSVTTGELYASYLGYRRTLSRERGALFLSESRRNKAAPISLWTWTKVVEAIAEKVGAPQFTTHTLRHLCLTDLARAGWDIHEIATFAGHRSTTTTLQYIHLSGHELADKFDRSMRTIHAWRTGMMKEALV